MQSFWVEMNVQSASESLFSMEQAKKQEASLKSQKCIFPLMLNIWVW